ncbi:MAG: ferredoxin reductase [Alcaligenaceae bacterium]|nr:MAG: ferredoxin reductase [Alcaligenaceae bacterium]
MRSVRRIVVVGASQAGLACATALRGYGFEGEITMIGDERHHPYTRPPLSKGVLVGSESDDSVFLGGAGSDITLRTGTSAAGLDRMNRLVTLDDGEQLPYDGLVIATGARARRIEADLTRREVTLRTFDDALALRDGLVRARDVAVVGGGFLGMEIASSAVKMGKAVTVVDQTKPLSAHLGPLLADMCLTAAVDHGAKVRVVSGGVQIGFDEELPRQVLTSDRTVIADADLVVTAAGDVPNTEWLRGSGVRIDNGVVVDDRCQVAPGIVAAGDVVSMPTSAGRIARRPHWWNALRQAKVASATLLHQEAASTPNSNVPFFWTEVFGLSIRVAGQLPPCGEPTVLEGSAADRCGLMVWPAGPENFGTAVAVNFPISAAKLGRIANQTPTQ